MTQILILDRCTSTQLFNLTNCQPNVAINSYSILYVYLVPDIPLRPPPSPRIESRNGLQQTAVRTPRSAEVMTPTKLALPERSKTMYVDRRSPMVPEARAQSRNGAFGKVSTSNL